MRKITLWDRFRYTFDNLMARGTVMQVIGLALFTIVASIGFALLVWFTGLATEISLFEQFITYLAFTLSADPLTGQPWLMRVITFVIYLITIFVTSILIGLLGSGIEAKIQELRKGRSVVIESDHTVILGWTEAIFPILSELVAANRSRKRAAVVILAKKDKIEMEDEIRDKVGDTGSTRIVCRTGSAMDVNDLALTSLTTSRSILVLGAEGDDSDAAVIKGLLAITQSPDRRKEPYHIVAEIEQRFNLDAASMIGGDEVELVLPGELISRIMAQTSRQPGLSVAYIDLLNFGGDEIYYTQEPALVGKTFGEALFAYEDSAVIGLLDGKGLPKLNPPMDTVIQADDCVIAIAEDDTLIKLSGLSEFNINKSAIMKGRVTKPKAENILILGWNPRGAFIVRELGQSMAANSKIKVLAHVPEAKEQLNALSKELKRVTLELIEGSTTDRETLNSLPYKDFHNIILLSYSGQYDVQKADAMTLVSLLHLRDIKEKSKYPITITSEILDIRNQKLAEVTQADDFVVSDQIISLMLAQISENKHLGPIFEDILDADGSELYIKPITNYIDVTNPINFYTLVEAARQRGEVAIGYRISKQARDAGLSYGVHLNPDKSPAVTFCDQDSLIVVAQS
jgi:voltage-gated potassium channel Kch